MSPALKPDQRQEKDITRVLDALKLGFDNSNDIADELGIQRPAVSGYLDELRKMGLARITKSRAGCWNERGQGPRFHRWTAAPEPK